MKTKLLTLAFSTCALSLLAQGTVFFINHGTDFRAPIYGPQLGNPAVSLIGNASDGLPAGTTVYTGERLAGSGYVAQLFSAPGANAPEYALVASPNSVTTFRTGSAAGFFAGVTATLANVPKDAAVATLQVRVWDNSSGLYPTWTQALPAWQSGLTAAALGNLFTVNAIGGDFNTPPLPLGMRSFNMIPEPSTYALLALGGFGLWLYRRRKLPGNNNHDRAPRKES
jgi:hypothetical protein